MNVSMRLLLCAAVLLVSPVKGMIKTSKNIKKVPKASFRLTSPKNTRYTPKLDVFVPRQEVGPSTLDRSVESRSLQDPSLLMLLPEHAWAVDSSPKRSSYFAIKKMDPDLQKRGYGTTIKAKTNLIKRLERGLNDTNSLLRERSVRNRVGDLMSSKSIEAFSEEPHDFSMAKKNLIDAAAHQGLDIPVDPAERIRLAYRGDLPAIKELLVKDKFLDIISIKTSFLF